MTYTSRIRYTIEAYNDVEVQIMRNFKAKCYKDGLSMKAGILLVMQCVDSLLEVRRELKETDKQQKSEVEKCEKSQQ